MWKYIYKKREDFVLSREYPIGMVRQFPPPNWNPPVAFAVVAPFRMPGYQNLDERLACIVETDRISNNQKMKSWKPVAHYKRYVAYSDSIPASVSSRMHGNIPDDETPMSRSHRFPYYCKSTIAYGDYAEPGGPLPRGNPLLLSTDPSFYEYFGHFGQHFNAVTPMVDDHGAEYEFGDEFGRNTVRAEGHTDWIPLPDNIDELTAVALQNVMPGVKQELSTLNFLIELKDLRRIVPNVQRALNFSDALVGIVKRIRKDFVGNSAKRLPSRLKLASRQLKGGSRTLLEATQIGAANHLSYEFGLRPFVQDLVQAYQGLLGFERTLRSILDRRGRLIRKHFTCDFRAEYLEDPVRTKVITISSGQFADRCTTIPEGLTGAFRGYGSAVEFERYSVCEPARFVCVVEYQFDLTPVEEALLPLTLLLDRFGLVPNLSTLWNAIPYSFLIDWIAGVSSYLTRFNSIKAFAPSVRIIRSSRSVLYKRRIRTRAKSTQDGGTFKFWSYLPDVFESAYRRDIDVLTADSFLSTSGLSSRELSLGASLTVSKIRPRRFAR